MSSNSAARFLRRVTPPPRRMDDLDSPWIPSPKEVESPPALLWNADPLSSHETMMGACLLSPNGFGFPEWKVRRKVMYTTPPAAEEHPLPVKEEPLELPEVKTEPEASLSVKEEPCELFDLKTKTLWQWQIAKKRSSNRKRKETFNWDVDEKPVLDKGVLRKRKVKVEWEDHQVGLCKKPKVDRWSVDRYSTAEQKMVDIMRGLGARLERPVKRHVLRVEARRHIGDTGLLDHLLKHMAGKVVEDGRERFQRRHNSAGDLEYWLEPAEMAEIRRKAEVSDPYWVPPPGWKLGDPIHLSPCCAECKREMNRLRGEVEALRRVQEGMLQWKGNVEHRVGDVVVGMHETPLDDCHLSPKSAGMAGCSARQKIKLIIKQPQGMPSSHMNLGDAREQQIRMKMNGGDKKGQKNSRHYKKVCMNNNEKQEGQLMRGSKVDRWTAERYRKACWKLVEIMREMEAELETPIMRQDLRDEARKHIGDTGLLDHLLKHLAGKVVVGGTERLQRRHNTNGAMVYWLEPADLVEIRLKAGVTDPYWVPPPGWQLGDATSPFPCSVECKKEMDRLREEIDNQKRNVERLRALLQLKKQTRNTQPEAGQLPELSEMEGLVEEMTGRYTVD